MKIEDLQHPTDRVVFETIVKLVRKVPWGPSRDALERHAGELESSMRFVPVGNGRPRADAGMEWQIDLYRLAAQTRFPRDGDTALARFVEGLVEDIRLLKDTGFVTSPPSMRDVSEAFEISLEALGVGLDDLPLPPTLLEMIDRGAERPHYVSEDRWSAAEKAYYHQMTLDNTPDEFIYGDRDDDYDEHDFGQYDDDIGCCDDEPMDDEEFDIAAEPSAKP